MLWQQQRKGWQECLRWAALMPPTLTQNIQQSSKISSKSSKNMQQHREGKDCCEIHGWSYKEVLEKPGGFWPMASYLVKNKRSMSKIETDISDVDYHHHCLEAWDHTFKRSQIPTISQTMEAGHFILTSEAVDLEDEALMLGKNRKRQG
ncbi:hypothetical protein BYT27DRAFT_7217831 [Phlegmacium glaucopus]|nr:hypothetical protein BYT27DRAFT_7217831 [Phlegmacium glaucopus]